jgi:superfamily II DNA or RNA helicase
MLRNILSGFKLNALKTLAGQHSIAFVEETLGLNSEFYESSNQHDFLIDAILNSNPQSIFLDTNLRNFFIDRIDSDYLIEIIEKVNDVKIDLFEPWMYENVKSFFENKQHLSKLLKVLGLNSLQTLSEVGADYVAFKTIKPAYGLYPYQVEISEKTYHSLENGDNDRAIIHLPTGAGKTRTAMHIICRHLMTKPDALVLWLANSDILCEQASEEFEEAWSHLGNRPILQGRFYRDNVFSLNSINSGVVVAGLQKLHSYFNSLDPKSISTFDQKVTLVVFDEAHRALASTYKQIVERFLHYSKQAKLIGLTATPGRIYRNDKPELDPQNVALGMLFNNNKITMDVSPMQPMEYLIAKNYLADPKFIELKYDDIDLYSLSGDELSESELMSKLSKSRNRNSKIIQTVVDEVKNKDAKVIVFACDIEHARNLAFTLCCLGIKAASIDSKFTSRIEKENIISQYKEGHLSVLVNCEMLTTGFDAPQTNVAVIARPTESLVMYLQMIGRALRGNSDQTPKTANIYTVLDEISEFNNVNLAFKHWNKMWNELER